MNTKRSLSYIVSQHEPFSVLGTPYILIVYVIFVVDAEQLMDKTLPVPLKVEPSAPCSNIVQCPQTSATEHLLESATVVIDNVEVVECKIPTGVVDSGKHKEENELNLLVSDVRSASANNHQPQAQSKTQPHNTNPKLECGYVTNTATAPEPKYHDHSSDSLEALSGPESNSIVKVDVTSIDATPTTTPSVVMLDDHKIQVKILGADVVVRAPLFLTISVPQFLLHAEQDLCGIKDIFRKILIA